MHRMIHLMTNIYFPFPSNYFSFIIYRNMIANTEDSDKSNSVLINGNQINEEIDKNTPGDDSSLQTPIEGKIIDVLIYFILFKYFYTGSYSKREKEKWLNPIPLENNPYSKENLDKRLKKNTTSDINGYVKII